MALEAHESQRPDQTYTYNLETAKATLEACTRDLASEEARTSAIDGKLSQLAAFAGVSISISASVGGSVVAGGRLSLGFSIALGACLGLAAVLLLGGVISAFAALSPKVFHGVDEAEVLARTRPDALRRDPSEVFATFAGSRRDILQQARVINDGKAEATTRTFRLVGSGFAMLVVAVVVTSIGSVV